MRCHSAAPARASRARSIRRASGIASAAIARGSWASKSAGDGMGGAIFWKARSEGALWRRDYRVVAQEL